MLNLIVAISKNHVIGHKGTLPWSFPEDLQRFKRITMGSTLIMGRKTHESIGRALPGRRNLVVSRTLTNAPAGVELVRNITEAITLALDVPDGQPTPEMFVIGGASIYTAALPLVQRVYLTEVGLTVEGDTTLRLDLSGFTETHRRSGGTGELTFVTYERTSSRPKSTTNPS